MAPFHCQIKNPVCQLNCLVIFQYSLVRIELKNSLEIVQIIYGKDIGRFIN